MRDEIIFRISECEMTMAEFGRFVRQYQAEHPDAEVFLDGDAKALIARYGE